MLDILSALTPALSNQPLPMLLQDDPRSPALTPALTLTLTESTPVFILLQDDPFTPTHSASCSLYPFAGER